MLPRKENKEIIRKDIHQRAGRKQFLGSYPHKMKISENLQ